MIIIYSNNCFHFDCYNCYYRHDFFLTGTVCVAIRYLMNFLMLLSLFDASGEYEDGAMTRGSKSRRDRYLNFRASTY